MLRIASDTDHAGPVPVLPAVNAEGSEATLQLLASLEEFLDRLEVSTDVDDGRLRDCFRESRIPGEPEPAESYFAFLMETVLRHATNMSSPRCLGHMTAGVAAPLHPLGNLLLGLNQNLVKSEAARTLGLLERQTLAMLHRLVFDESDGFYQLHAQHRGSTLGLVTTGGSLTNLAALWCARNAAFPPSEGFAGVEVEGLPAALRHHRCNRAVVLGSHLAHYSIEKAAGILGLGSRSFLEIPVDGDDQIDLGALEAAIVHCRQHDWKIVALIGAAGTTDCGSIDPLEGLAEIAARERIHLHVDAAWGAPLLFSEAYRDRLRGIDRADTVAVDGHKQLYLPIGLSMLLFRDPTAARVVEKQARYMLRDDSADLGQISIEGSRSGVVLFAHAAFHLLGRGGYRQRVETNMESAGTFMRMVAASEPFELLCEPATNLVVYRHIPDRFRAACRAGRLTAAENEQLNAHNVALQQAQHARGRSYVSRTILTHLPRYPGVPIVALRAVLANPTIRSSDLEAVLQDQLDIAHELTLGAELRPAAAEAAHDA
jgi:glutamate decarboxylase